MRRERHGDCGAMAVAIVTAIGTTVVTTIVPANDVVTREWQQLWYSSILKTTRPITRTDR